MRAYTTYTTHVPTHKQMHPCMRLGQVSGLSFRGFGFQHILKTLSSTTISAAYGFACICGQKLHLPTSVHQRRRDCSCPFLFRRAICGRKPRPPPCRASLRAQRRRSTPRRPARGAAPWLHAARAGRAAPCLLKAFLRTAPHRTAASQACSARTPSGRRRSQSITCRGGGGARASHKRLITHLRNMANSMS